MTAIRSDPDREGFQVEGGHQGPHGRVEHGRFDPAQAHRALTADQFDETGGRSGVDRFASGIDQDSVQATPEPAAATAALALRGRLRARNRGLGLARLSESRGHPFGHLLADSCAADTSDPTRDQ